MDEEKLEGGRFFMRHITNEQWLAYVKDELDEKVRIDYEGHLYGCDQCLALYIEAVEMVEQQASIITTDEIIQSVNTSVAMKQPKDIKEPSFYKKALFHYMVAAAMTLVLMSSGIFSQLIDVVSDIESEDANRSSVTSKIMDSSTSIIEQVQVKEGE